MNFRLPKWVVVAVAAAVFVPLAVDWVLPGVGARLAAEWLASACRGDRDGTVLFPLWGWLVGIVGKDVRALGWISIGAGLCCAWLVAVMVGTLFGAAVRGAKTGGIKDEERNYAGVESAAVLLAGLGFVLTPGLLIAATRISPLMVVLVPGLAAVALVVWVVFGLPIIAYPLLTGDQPTEVRDRVLNADVPIIDRLLMGKGRIFLALVLLAYSVYEVVLARRVVLSLTFPTLVVWLAVGVLPAILIAGCLRMRWMVGRKAIWGAFGGWALAVVAMASVAFTSGWLNEGRAANRIVATILKNAEDGGKVAIVSDGTLDELYYFMLPEGVKLISLARERDPEYGRELSEWVREEVKVKREGELRNLSFSSADQHRKESNSPLFTFTSDLHLGQVEDLAFAAELGPRALVDEWRKIDKAGFEAKVASAANYFPSREKWDAARAELAGMRADDPMAKYLRRLMGVCGNALGCRMLEEEVKVKGEGEQRRVDSSVRLRPSTSTESEAWAIFRAIVDEVDPENYAAFVNLRGMAERGFAVSKDEVAELDRRRQQIEKDLKGWPQIVRAARSSGRLYADPDELAKFEREQRKAAAKREPSVEAQKFAKTVAAAAKDAKSGKAAQEAIHKAIREGKVRADFIGERLIAIDLALGDAENAEKDAIDVLKSDRHNPAANAALGTIAGARGDYERAARYLGRAIATGRAPAAAKNDYAWVLCRMGRIDEAEPLAREAVKADGESWIFRETLAAILIRRGSLDEGGRELDKAEELAEKAGVPRRKTVSIEIDRARLLKAKGDMERFGDAMKGLRARRGLTATQREDIKAMDW